MDTATEILEELFKSDCLSDDDKLKMLKYLRGLSKYDRELPCPEKLFREDATKNDHTE